MNKPVILVALVLACIFSCNGISPELKAAVEECQTQHTIKTEQIKDAIENKKIPETENGQCFMSCVMEKMGMLKDGKIDLEKTMEINEKKFKDPESREKANEIAKRCANVKAADDKPCSFATEVVKCAIENAHELKLEMPKEEE